MTPLCFPSRIRAVALVAISALGLAATATADITVEERPVSLLSANVVMEQGRACIPLADLAKALGGTMQAYPEKRLVVITPGPAGLLRSNAGPLASFARRMKPRELTQSQRSISKSHAAEGIAASQNTAILSIGGANVMFDELEVILLRPNPLIPLSLLGKLLGGTARLDAKTNSWVLPSGGATSPLAFR